MKYTAALFFAVLLAAGCKEKKITAAEVEVKLMKAMNDYLNKNSNGVTTFTVKDVLFDARKDNYYCEFRVNMKDNTKDTTGTMTAFISYDFKKVERGQ